MLGLAVAKWTRDGTAGARRTDARGRSAEGKVKPNLLLNALHPLTPLLLRTRAETPDARHAPQLKMVGADRAGSGARIELVENLRGKWRAAKLCGGADSLLGRSTADDRRRGKLPNPGSYYSANEGSWAEGGRCLWE